MPLRRHCRHAEFRRHSTCAEPDIMMSRRRLFTPDSRYPPATVMPPAEMPPSRQTVYADTPSLMMPLMPSLPLIFAKDSMIH